MQIRSWSATHGGLTKHETSLTLLIYFGSYPLLYAVNVLLSRALGPENYGDYAVTRSVATLAATVAMLGLNKASLDFLPVYRKHGAHDAAKGYVALSAIAIVVAGVVLSIVGALFTELLLRRSGGEAHPVRIAMVWVLPMSIGLYSLSLLNGHQQVVLASLLDRIALPIITALLLGAVFLVGYTLTDLAAVWLLIGARMLLTLLLIWLLWSIWRREYSGVSASYQIKQWAGATLPFLLSALVIAAIAQSSTLILEARATSEDQVGIFAAAQQVAYLPLLALGAISTLAMPHLATLLEEDDRSTFEQQLGVYLRILTLFGIGSLVLFFFAGNAMLRLFGHNFADGHSTLVVLGIGYAFVLVGGLIVPILQIHNEKRIVSFTMLALLSIALTLTYLLVPRYGALGAALAYTIAVAIIYTLQLWLLERKIRLPYLGTIRR